LLPVSSFDLEALLGFSGDGAASVGAFAGAGAASVGAFAGAGAAGAGAGAGAGAAAAGAIHSFKKGQIINIFNGGKKKIIKLINAIY